MNRHLLLLAFCQGMFLTNTVTFIAVNGLAGLALAPVGWMATLPVTSYVIGGTLSAPLVARLQALLRRPGNLLGRQLTFGRAHPPAINPRAPRARRVRLG